MGMIRIQFPKDGDPEKIAELVRKIGREIEERNRKEEQEEKERQEKEKEKEEHGQGKVE